MITHAVPQLPETLEALLGRGIALVIGTANPNLRPEICRGWGPLWNAPAGELSVLLPLPSSKRTLDNLRGTKALACTFSMPTDYVSFQLKGRCTAIRQPDAEDWQRARRHFDAFLSQLPHVGLEPSTFAAWFPSTASVVVCRIDSAFSQAPGANAGAPI